jgi:Zn-dependent peptidase ImmA (M78 family)
MNTGERMSSLGIVLQCLGKIWEPAGEAFRVQNDLGVRSLEETTGALERAGYEICHVDLPGKVSGFAQVIADKPHVVLNRAKSKQELQYTVPHELGHHILHLNAVDDFDPDGFPRIGNAELEAGLFATSWLFCLDEDKQRNVVLLRNPEISRTLSIYFLLSVMIVLFGLLASFMLRNVPETK